MDNYENNNNNEYTNSTEEDVNQPQKYDPAGETKMRIIFFVVMIVVMIAVKYLLGY